MKYLLLLITLCVIVHSKAQTPSELLGRPTDVSITINVLSPSAMEIYWEYGIKQGNYSSKTAVFNIAEGQPFELEMGQLSPDTKYFYRSRFRAIGSNDGFAEGAEHFFQTQRKAGKSFRFAVEADPHLDSNTIQEAYRNSLRNMLLNKPDFLVDLGDNFMNDKLPNPNREEIKKRNLLFRSFFNELNHSVPLYLTLGNHEGEVGWRQKPGQDSLGIWATQTRKMYYPNPFPNAFYSGNTVASKVFGLPENYYSWQWGDALFLVIDPYINTKNRGEWAWTLGKEQYDWFRNTLEKSTAAFKFVFSHQLVGGSGKEARGGTEFAHLFEMGGRNADSTWGFDANRLGWGKPIHQLMVENKVSVFFHGHDHFYGKQDKDGVVYQAVPQPSSRNINKITGTAYGYKDGVLLPGRGYMLISVSSNEAKVEFIRTYLPSEENANRKNGEVAHSYTIQR